MAKEDEIEGLTPAQPFADAGRLIIHQRFREMWTHRAGTLAGDEDALHDMRVASRRLRAALDVFSTAFHGDEYRTIRRLTARLTDELGAVRDDDVMLIRLKKYRKAGAPDERAGLDDLMSTLIAERAVARRELRRFFDTLDAARYAQHMTDIFS